RSSNWQDHRSSLHPSPREIPERTGLDGACTSVRAREHSSPVILRASGVLFRKNQAMATTRLPLVWPQRPLPSRLRLSSRLRLQLSSSPQRRRPRPRDSCQLSLLRRDESCDNTRSIWKVALCAKASDRTALADSARILCPF